jgi:hypothetical protein
MFAVASSGLGLSPSYTYTSRGGAVRRHRAAAATRAACAPSGRASQTLLATSSAHVVPLFLE